VSIISRFGVKKKYHSIINYNDACISGITWVFRFDQRSMYEVDTYKEFWDFFKVREN